MITLTSPIGLADYQIFPLSNNADLLGPAQALFPELTELRRQFHEHPELAYEELQTSKKCAEYLTNCGFKVTLGLAGTGLIADFGTGEKMVAIRADMDALPIAEHNNVLYRSKKPGVMHACGHDAHMACALGAAKLLSTTVQQGRVRIIMQPAEEAERFDMVKGSLGMIEGGALKEVSALIGFHVDSTMPLGHAAILKEAASSFSTPFTLNVKTDGKEVDLLKLTSEIMQKLYKSKNEFSMNGAQLSLHSITASDPAGRATICGTVDYTSLQAVQDLRRAIQALCNGLAAADIFNVELQPAPGLLASHQLVINTLQAAAVAVLGVNNVAMTRRRTWTTRFADYTKHVPGAFLTLGTQINRSLRTMHSPNFDIDERVLPIGAALLSQMVLNLLRDDVALP